MTVFTILNRMQLCVSMWVLKTKCLDFDQSPPTLSSSANHLNTFTYKREIIIIPDSWGCCED